MSHHFRYYKVLIGNFPKIQQLIQKSVGWLRRALAPSGGLFVVCSMPEDLSLRANQSKLFQPSQNRPDPVSQCQQDICTSNTSLVYVASCYQQLVTEIKYLKFSLFSGLGTSKMEVFANQICLISIKRLNLSNLRSHYNEHFKLGGAMASFMMMKLRMVVQEMMEQCHLVQNLILKMECIVQGN